MLASTGQIFDNSLDGYPAPVHPLAANLFCKLAGQAPEGGGDTEITRKAAAGKQMPESR